MYKDQQNCSNYWMKKIKDVQEDNPWFTLFADYTVVMDTFNSICISESHCNQGG